MGLTLAEKVPSHADGSLHPDGQTCDLDSPGQAGETVDGFSSDDALALVPLVTAAAAVFLITLVLWLSIGASQRLLRWLWRQSSSKRRKYAADADDSADLDGGGAGEGLYGSPPTPPPVGWLRDADSASPSFVTPHGGTEPLLFSLSPHVGGGSGGGGPPHRYTAGPYGTQRHVDGAGGDQPLAAGRMQAYGSCGGARGSSGGGDLRQRSGGGHGDCRPGLQGSGGGAGRVRAAVGGGGGWDPALLDRQAALLPAMCSVEGLTADPAFQEYMRSTRGRSPTLAREQSHAKVQLYKELRRLDPDAFRRLFSRTDIKSYDVQRPSLALAVVEYLVGSLLVPVAILALTYSPRATGGWALLGHLLVVAWLLTKLWLASSGHTSLLGRLLGVYLVYDTPDDLDSSPGSGGGSSRGGRGSSGGNDYRHLGNAWEHMAGLGGHVLLALFEVSMAVASLGLLVVGSLLSMALGSRRQTLAMRLLGLRLEREVYRQTHLSPFSPVSEGACATSCRGSVRRGLGRGPPGRYGLFS